VLKRWGFDLPPVIEDVAPGQRVVVVDTNNPAELPPSINDAEIVAIIDHHKLVPGIETKTPIEVTIRPVACTATLLWQLMGGHGGHAPEGIRGLALSAILSDTLEFRSPTTTPVDRNLAERLAADLGVDIPTLAAEMFEAKSDVSHLSEKELLRLDSKEYTVDGVDFRISVLETVSPQAILKRKEALMAAMPTVAAEDGAQQVLLFVIDILREEATLLSPRPAHPQRRREDRSAPPSRRHRVLPGIMSRKKQSHPGAEVGVTTPPATIGRGLRRDRGPLRRGPRGPSGAACTTGFGRHIPAVQAMQAFRRNGGRVVLGTNAPRPRRLGGEQILPGHPVGRLGRQRHLRRRRRAWAMFRGAVGRRVWFMGQEVDLAFFEPPRLVEAPLAVERVPLDEAEGIACCGPFDPHADPDANRPDFERAVARGLPLLCANPDIVVDRGHSREWCAGALAQLYEAMGGRALYFGKPHAPIYDLARQRLAEVAPLPPDARIVAVGDGPLTDVLGAARAGLDCLFVSGGLAAVETGTAPGGQPDPAKLDAYLAAEGMAPRWTVGFLR
jgi:manganese-dependent inorganic pyrophosphatase